MKTPTTISVTLSRIIGGGQAIGTLETGQKVLVWGGLPSESVEVVITKKKSHYLEGVVENVLTPSTERIAPRDADSYLSTSPWQIMTIDAEQHYKAALLEEAFELHDIVLPDPITVFSDKREYEYRNKIEYSFWFDTDSNRLSLAFFRRGTHGKIAVDSTSLASLSITAVSKVIIKVLNDLQIGGRDLKTVMIRSNANGDVAWQLYVKNESIDAEAIIKAVELLHPSVCGEVIYSNPKSPASVITKRLASSSDNTLSDTILGVPFRYATEGFFQINLPVYEQALRDMKEWVEESTPVIDLYSGVGTIGLTIGGDDVTLIELNQHAVKEMKK
ncbi:MAG: putative methyltransferase, partial [Candidatus Saccharibacteria bacterium]|nr:putative methyltransferase [Candidatus Saccharibacteria bacterium]